MTAVAAVAGPTMGDNSVIGRNQRCQYFARTHSINQPLMGRTSSWGEKWDKEWSWPCEKESIFGHSKLINANELNLHRLE